MNFRSIVFTVAILAFAATSAMAQTTRPVAQAVPAFVIGVWQQPASNFAAWQARGANTLVQIPTGSTWTTAAQTQWVAAAEEAGLWQIRAPVAPLGADYTPHLLAYAQPDEPEDGASTAAVCAANYTAWKKAQPAVPVYIGFDGSRVLGLQGGLTQANYTPYFAAADWTGQDIYPVTCWGQASLQWLQYPGKGATTLSAWSGGKPQFALIECSNQRIGPSQLATTAQIRYEVWHSVICGATGIVWFPQQFNGFNWDGTTPAIQAEITELDKELIAVAPYLAGAKTLNLGAGWEGLSNTKGNFTLVINAGDAVAGSGVQFPPYGAYATANGIVIAQTPMPPTADQLYDRLVNDESNFTATLNDAQSQTAQLQRRMSAIGAAATQP